ncbi:hypothetical protein GSY74_08900 [Sulfurovum sp. bin170]|uniref:hypothetical protein n=1 Tax=Sulfurovum sp. bin170 TaxID=2695268 RepID=UPI0013DFCE65|nr:hypothetical protein [Sulfurovum sp. bin170]NEW61399.1 hypothetical protein [Sulfurovum sp. bin170]
MKGLTEKTVLFLAIMALMLNACVKIEIRDDNRSSEKVTSLETSDIQRDEVHNTVPTYGEHTADIEKLLAVTPIGSEISLEETEDGELRLRIEKIFTAGNSQDETLTEEIMLEENPYQGEIDSSLYGETITI